MVRASLADHPANGVLAETDLAGDLGVHPVFDMVEPKDRLHCCTVAAARRMESAIGIR